jgi:acetoin utilization deacetylase AcuC-like enzyme
LTQFLTHPICLRHDPGAGHPERPARLEAVVSALSDERFRDLDRVEAPKAEIAAIARVHDEAYVAHILDSVPVSGYRALDPDTTLSPESGEAALRSAGAVVAAVDAVMTGEAGNAFVATRPPGHHAERARAMGFCLFNNVAIGAAQARAEHGTGRVAVVDFDVHHGNGTQSMFWDDADLFYASSHQSPAYPGTGAASETGAHGNIVNVPLAPGSGSAEFRAAYAGTILPALSDFAPELLIISAGFDAHVRDPLCQLRVETEDFEWVTAELLAIASEKSEGRVVSALEGGYDLTALAECATVHVAALMA